MLSPSFLQGNRLQDQGLARQNEATCHPTAFSWGLNTHLPSSPKFSNTCGLMREFRPRGWPGAGPRFGERWDIESQTSIRKQSDNHQHKCLYFPWWDFSVTGNRNVNNILSHTWSMTWQVWASLPHLVVPLSLSNFTQRQKVCFPILFLKYLSIILFCCPGGLCFWVWEGFQVL